VPAPLRLGLVGAGPWGRNYIRTLAGCSGLRLARVASRNPRTAALVPRDCVVTPDWRTVVSAEDLDGVIVAAPPASHAEIVLAAIEAGRPVLVEKPLALDTASAERIVALASDRHVLVMVDHVHLFHPGYRALKREAAAGRVLAIHSRAGDLGPYRPDVSVLWDWGPHDVAMCIDLLSREPESVDAESVERRRVGAASAERMRLVFAFSGNVTATIELSTLDPHHRKFSVQLDSRTVEYGGEAPASFADLPLTRAVTEFAEAVTAQSAALESVQLGAAVVRTLARCDACLVSGGPQ
jgi:predicted dehydrogenase